MSRAKKEFYKTTIVVEVLSENTIEFDSLSDIDAMTTTGDCSGQITLTASQKLTEKEMATALLNQGSDPTFLLGTSWEIGTKKRNSLEKELTKAAIMLSTRHP